MLMTSYEGAIEHRRAERPETFDEPKPGSTIARAAIMDLDDVNTRDRFLCVHIM